ncbi:hypothetical protein ACYSNR_14980 [Enterococcus sp. LJL128]
MSRKQEYYELAIYNPLFRVINVMNVSKRERDRIILDMILHEMEYSKNPVEVRIVFDEGFIFSVEYERVREIARRVKGEK